MDGVKRITRIPEFAGDEARPNPALVVTAAALRSMGRLATYGEMLVWSGCAFEFCWLRQPEAWSWFRPNMTRENWRLVDAAVGGGLECLAADDFLRLPETADPAALRARIIRSIDEDRPVLGFPEGGCPYALCVGYRPGAAEREGLLWRAIFCVDKARVRGDRLMESGGTPLVFFSDQQRQEPDLNERLTGALTQALVQPQLEELPQGWALYAGAEAAARAAEDVRTFTGEEPELRGEFSAYCLTALHELHDARSEAERMLRQIAGGLVGALAQQAQELAGVCLQESALVWAMASEWLDFTTQDGLYRAYDRFVHSWSPQRQEEVGDCYAALAELERRKERVIREMVRAG